MACEIGQLDVSTVTGTASLGSIANLSELFVRTEPSDTVVSLRSPDGRHVKPLDSMPCLGKMVGKHLTLIVQLQKRDARCHAKLYANGTVHVTGVRSSAEIDEACQLIAGTFATGSSAFDVRTRMVNAYFKHTPVISRTMLVRYIARETELSAVFDPSVSPEARVYFCFHPRTSADPQNLAEHDGCCTCAHPCAFMPARLRRCYRVIGIVHGTGTVMMSGSGSEAHLRHATKLLQKIMVDVVRAES
jgi:TATA-box binding protein (TBP) (component of TFIID and TFIIIB)